MTNSFSKTFEDSKTILSRYFINEDKKYDLLVKFTICVVGTLVITALGAVFGWYCLPAIYAAFIAKNIILLLINVSIALLIILVRTYISYHVNQFKSGLIITWRNQWQRDLAEKFTNKYPADNTNKYPADNSSEKIARDVSTVVQLFVNLSIGFIENFINLVVYTVLLILIGGPFQFTLFDIHMLIPDFLVFVAFSVGISSTLITAWINQGLEDVSNQLSKSKAEFRSYLEKLFTNSLTGNDKTPDVLLKNIYDASIEQASIESKHTAFESFSAYVHEIIPFISAAPLYFTDILSLDAFLSVSYDFSWITYSIGWFINAWPQLIELRACFGRVMDVEEKLGQQNGLVSGKVSDNLATHEEMKEEEEALSYCA